MCANTRRIRTSWCALGRAALVVLGLGFGPELQAAEPRQLSLRLGGAASLDDAASLRPVWEAAYQVNDRCSIRLRGGPYWLGGDLDGSFTLAASALAHAGGERSWKPYFGAGVLFAARRNPGGWLALPEPSSLPPGPHTSGRVFPFPPELGEDRWAGVATFGIETALARRWGLFAQTELIYPRYEEVPSWDAAQLRISRSVHAGWRAFLGLSFSLNRGGRPPAPPPGEADR